MVDSVKGGLESQIAALENLGKNSPAKTQGENGEGFAEALENLGRTSPAKTGGEGGEGFAEALKQSIEKVNMAQHEADAMMEGLATGESRNIHETMIAVEKANLSFNMMVQVRNKLLAAYEEVMRMQI